MALIEHSLVLIGEGGVSGGGGGCKGMFYVGNGTNITLGVVFRSGGITHSGPQSPEHSRVA